MKNFKEFKKVDFNLDEWEFDFQQRDDHPISMADIWCKAMKDEFPNEINLDVPQLDYLFTNSATGYVKKEQKSKILNELEQAIENNPTEYLNYITDRTKNRIEVMDEKVENILSNLNDVDKEGLAVMWNDFYEFFLTLVPWFYIPWYITERDIIALKVKSALENHKKEIERITDFHNALMILMEPPEDTAVESEQKEFSKLLEIAMEAENFKESETFQQEAKEYLEDYGWMRTFVFLPIEPLDFKGLVERIENKLEETTLEGIKSKREERKEKNELAYQLTEQLEGDEKVLFWIQKARNISWLLNWSVDNTLRLGCKLQPFYKRISKELGINWSEWVHLVPKEIYDGLRGETDINSLDLRKRQKGYVYLMEDGESRIIVGEKGSSISGWLDKNIRGVDQEVVELDGSGVSPGVVSGKVVVASNPGEARKLEKGDILVCSMTSPDWVPSMKKAGAIVTDEGGMLSHAAIVSRELNTSCVVGTQNATQVLSDGDMVEVDADEGIIRIIGENYG